MPKKPDPRRIKKHRVYTPFEAAEALSVHTQTLLRWIKAGALEADRSCRPWLIEGHALKRFLEERRSAGKCRLRLEQIFCLPCRAPRVPDGRMADFQLKTPTTGMLTGLCPECGRLIHKRTRRGDLDAIRAHLDVTIQKAEPRIVGNDAPFGSVTFSQEAAGNAKTQVR